MKEKIFKYNDQEHICTEQDILRKCGSEALELVRCKKGRYGFEVVYKMKPGYYDDRDSSLVSKFISYFLLIKKVKN
jgi:hypothetical protein